jgi:endo-1,4-beta-D-glucanase Y
MTLRHVGILGITLALIIALIGIYRFRSSETSPLVFSPTQVLSSSWYTYKKLYVDPNTFRTIDRQRADVTTSEGQSYTMLRAVWEGDESTFDGAWIWTKTNLARPSDHLFAWIWGTRSDGTGGVLTSQNGENSASDADTDVALSLIFAYARWQDPQYLTQARNILNDIWNNEVISIAGKPYLAADSVEKTSPSPTIVVNPSYLSPAAYHIFATADPTHPWEALRTNAYSILSQSASLALDSSKSSSLPPDWVLVNKKTGEMTAAPAGTADTAFGFDALRVPFRVALDQVWFHNPSATKFLKSMSYLGSAWNSSGALAASYSHDGTPLLSGQSAAMYGGTLGYFMASDPEAANRIYRSKLLSLYDATIGGWSPTLSYYDDNWAWFGVALYNGQLPNLAEGLPPSAFTQYSLAL